jgi:hypothetical protein
VNGIHRVSLLKVKAPNTFNYRDLVMQYFNIFELRLYEDFMTDDIFIFDMDNMTFNDVNKMTPSLVTKALTIYKVKLSLNVTTTLLILTNRKCTHFE